MNRQILQDKTQPNRFGCASVERRKRTICKLCAGGSAVAVVLEDGCKFWLHLQSELSLFEHEQYYYLKSLKSVAGIALILGVVSCIHCRTNQDALLPQRPQGF